MTDTDDEEAQARYRAREHEFRDVFLNPEKLSDLPEALVECVSEDSLARTLIDDSTIEQALFFVGFGEIRSVSPELFDNRWIVARSLNALLEALVLSDRVLTGLGGYGPKLLDEYRCLHPLRGVFSDEFADLDLWRQFGLLGLARSRAIQLLDECGANIAESISFQGSRRFSVDQLKEQLLSLSPRAADISSHKVAPYVDDDAHFLSVMRGSVLGPAHYGTYGETADDALSRAKQSSGMQGGRVHFGDDPASFFAAHVYYRAVLYGLLADIAGATYHGDALRAPLLRAMAGPRASRPFAAVVMEALAEDQAARDEAANETLGYAAFHVPLPSIAHLVMSRASCREEIFDIAIDVRESLAATRFRAYCHNVDATIAAGDREGTSRALADLAQWGLKANAELAMEKFDLSAGKDLLSIYSPLAGALVGVLGYPLKNVKAAFRRRRFAFLETLRTSPRVPSPFLVSRVNALWPDGYERPERTHFRHW
jgi:hypothetical protein